MNTEKAIQLLHRLQDEQFDGIHGDERREALEMAVRALVEPNIGQKTIDCIIKRLSDEDRTTDDCISRQAAMVVFENSGLDDDSKDTVVRVLEQLPSAQPERKTGHWIGYAGTIGNECSICNKWLDVLQGTAEMNYCPNCGAKMEVEHE